MFKAVNNNVDFVKQEEEILALWQKNDTFKKSLDQRKDNDEFVFYDGPVQICGKRSYGKMH